MKKMFDDFKAFLGGGNLIPIAVAFLMATAFAPVVVAFAEGIIMQLVAAIVGKPDFSSVGIDVGDSRLLIGDVINAAITFVIIAFVCFLIGKAYEKMHPAVVEESGPSEVDLLIEIRDSLRSR